MHEATVWRVRKLQTCDGVDKLPQLQPKCQQTQHAHPKEKEKEEEEEEEEQETKKGKKEEEETS